jgi:hypothetical protein
MIFPAYADSPILPAVTRSLGVNLISENKPKVRGRLPNSGPSSASLVALKPSDLKRGFRLGRILDLHKQELSIRSLSSGRQQTLAPLGPYSQRMSGMQSQMVRAVPILCPDSGGGMAKPNPPLCSLQQTAETGNACGLATPPSVAPGIKTQNLQSSLFLKRFGNR